MKAPKLSLSSPSDSLSSSPAIINRPINDWGNVPDSGGSCGVSPQRKSQLGATRGTGRIYLTTRWRIARSGRFLSLLLWSVCVAVAEQHHQDLTSASLTGDQLLDGRALVRSGYPWFRISHPSSHPPSAARLCAGE